MPQFGTTVQSLSGQFFISTTATEPAPAPTDLAAGRSYISVQPALLAISCERIKENLWRELGVRGPWQGKIFVHLRHAFSADESVTVVSERFGGQWICRVELPDFVERNRFVEGITGAVLLEIANRNAVEHSAEVPQWLAAGLSRELLASQEIQLILPPPQKVVNSVTLKFVDHNERKTNSLFEAQQILNAHLPLTFDQLSWPSDEQVSGDDGDVFRSSAQVFVAELMRLKNGPANLRAMLGKLADRWNWQIAFLDAFHADFQKPLDIEKWWALQLVQFSGRDLLQLWTLDESLKKLDAALRLPVEVRAGDAAPLHTEINLQTAVREWDRSRQLQVLRQKLFELALLRIHLAPDAVPLADDYRQALQTYFQKRNASAKIVPVTGPIPDVPTEDLVKALNELDARREGLHAAASPVATAK